MHILLHKSDVATTNYSQISQDHIHLKYGYCLFPLTKIRIIISPTEKNNPAPTFCAPNKKDSINDKTEFNQLAVTLSQRRLFSYNGYRRAIGSHCTKRPAVGNVLQEGQRKVIKGQLESCSLSTGSRKQRRWSQAVGQVEREQFLHIRSAKLTWAWKVSISLSLFSAASCFSLTFISSSSLAIISSSCLLTCRRGFT